MNLYDIVVVDRPWEEGEFVGLIIGICDTSEIYSILVHENHPILGEGWIVRYVGKENITPESEVNKWQ